MVDPYQRQVAPQRVGSAVGQANAQQLGGGIGDVLGSIGDVVGENALADLRLKQQQDRDIAAAQAIADAAATKERIAMAALDAQDNAAPGAAGFAKSMSELLDKETGAFVASIKDPVVRQRYQAAMSEWASEQRVRFEGYERGQTAKLGVTNVQTGIDLIANRVSRDMPAEEFDRELQDLRNGIAAIEGLPADVRLALEKEAVEQVSYSWVLGKPANQAKALLASGAFDGMISPKAMQQLNNSIDVDIRRQQVELEAQQRAKLAESREAIDMVITQLKDGAVIPDDQLKALTDTATTLGLDKQGYDLIKIGISNEVNRTYRAATPSMISVELKRVQADIASRDDSVPATLAMRRDALQSLLTARTRDAANDPLAVAAQNGITIEAIDWSSRQSVAKREAAAIAAARLTGGPARFLQPEELSQMQANMRTPQGRMLVAEQLSNFSGQNARRAAEQVAPNDRLFHYSLGLNPASRQLVFEGQAVQQSGKVKVDMTEARQTWAQRVAPATRQLGQTASGATFEMAVAIYAQAMERRGETEFSERVFRDSINTALGGTFTNGVRKGGMGEWNGRPVILPTKFSQQQFEQKLALAKPKTAYHRSGQPVTGMELRANYTPVMVGPNRYAFVNARGEFVGTKKRGELYILNFGEDPR